MLSTSPLLHSPFPHWHSLFPPQKVQFMVASLGNGSTVSQKTCSLTPLSTRGDDSELCPWHCCCNVFGTLEFLFMWVFKWFWCPVMWRRHHLSFPRWRGHRDRDAGCDPVWLRPGSPGSGSLTETSYCFHREGSAKAVALGTVYLQWLFSEKRTSPRALTRGTLLGPQGHWNLLVWSRVSACYLAYVKWLLAQCSWTSCINTSCTWATAPGGSANLHRFYVSNNSFSSFWAL